MTSLEKLILSGICVANSSPESRTQIDPAGALLTMWSTAFAAARVLCRNDGIPWHGSILVEAGAVYETYDWRGVSLPPPLACSLSVWPQHRLTTRTPVLAKYSWTGFRRSSQSHGGQGRAGADREGRVVPGSFGWPPRRRAGPRSAPGRR